MLLWIFKNAMIFMAKFDRLPHPKVRSRALFCIVLWCGMAWIIFKFSALRGNVEVLFAMIAFPFFA